MDWTMIRAELKSLRATRPEFANYGRFKKASGINRQTVEDTEDGTNRPTLEIIEKWVTACGGSLATFFAQLEPPPPKAGPTVRIPVLRRNRKLHERLEALLNEPDDPSAYLRDIIDVSHGALVGRQAGGGSTSRKRAK